MIGVGGITTESKALKKVKRELYFSLLGCVAFIVLSLFILFNVPGFQGLLVGLLGTVTFGTYLDFLGIAAHPGALLRIDLVAASAGAVGIAILASRVLTKKKILPTESEEEQVSLSE